MKNSNTFEVAVGGLMKALDDSPRANWPRVIEMAMAAVHDVGYSEGYRVGFREDDKRYSGQKADMLVIDEKPGPAPGPTPAFRQDIGLAAALLSGPPEGEDKALTNSKPSADEELEDIGFEFIKEIARQIGLKVIGSEVHPRNIEVNIMPTGDLSPGAASAEIRIKLNFNHKKG